MSLVNVEIRNKRVYDNSLLLLQKAKQKRKKSAAVCLMRTPRQTRNATTLLEEDSIRNSTVNYNTPSAYAAYQTYRAQQPQPQQQQQQDLVQSARIRVFQRGQSTLNLSERTSFISNSFLRSGAQTSRGQRNMEYIAVGQSVKIKRTDGRVHAAVVSKINDTNNSITVEWYERGETKGKEIDLDALISLNPEILQVTPETEQFKVPEPKLQLSQTATSTNLRNAFGGRTNTEATNNTNNSSSNNVSGIGRIGNRHTINSSSMATMSSHMTSSDHSENIAPPAAPTGIMRSRTTNNATRMSLTNQNNGGGLSNNSTSGATTNFGTTTNSTGANLSVRRSGVVKEVERLKENREKRRARHAELKEEKVALMNQDPGNPHWETLQMIREYQSGLDFSPLIDGLAYEDHQITVCVRKRPLSRKEVTRKEVDVISVPRKDLLIVHEPRNKVDLTKFLEHHKFRFDYAFDDRCDNAIVYKYTAKPLVKTIFEGGMATCFAYGQTGSGKTHTMGGEFNGKIQDCKNGIYAMAAKDVFAYLNMPRYRSLNLVVSASFFEIYSGKVFDLLSDKQKLRVLEDGKQQVQVVGLTEKVVDSVEEVLKLIQHGNNARTSGQTSANSNSSRSHAVFQIVLRPPGQMQIHGKFSFIDLAGNERGADTSSSNRQTRMEGAEINKSLLALKECIRALGKQSAHLPFRVSKLTQVLRDSFIGEKSKTCMIAMISPGLSSCEHTLNTLRYADRVKELVVKDTPDMLREEGSQIREELDLDVDEAETDSDQYVGNNSPKHSQRNQIQSRSNAGQNYNNNNNNINRNKKNGQMSQNDLALLRSLSEHDMSDELLTQHEAITDLQQAEEMVVEQHRAINEFLAQFLPESSRLYNLTNFVDYDQDAYCKQGEVIFTQLADLAMGCRDMMADFRAKLAKEEMLSCTVKPPGKR